MTDKPTLAEFVLALKDSDVIPMTYIDRTDLEHRLLALEAMSPPAPVLLPRSSGMVIRPSDLDIYHRGYMKEFVLHDHSADLRKAMPKDATQNRAARRAARYRAKGKGRVT